MTISTVKNLSFKVAGGDNKYTSYAARIHAFGTIVGGESMQTALSFIPYDADQ